MGGSAVTWTAPLLAGWAPASLPSFLPRLPPVSAPPPRIPLLQTVELHSVCAQAGTGDQQVLRSGCGGRDSSLVQRAHCAPRVALAGASGYRGRPPHHPRELRGPSVFQRVENLEPESQRRSWRLLVSTSSAGDAVVAGHPSGLHLSPPVPRASLNSHPLENSHLYSLYLLLFSRSVVSDSLQPHGLYGPGILQSRILEWVVVPFSRGSPQSRN